MFEFSAALTTKAAVSADPTERDVEVEDSAARLERHLIACWQEIDCKRWIVVINSSGNGKTFACIKLCSRMRALYTLARKLDHYAPTPEVVTFVEVLTSASNLAQKNAVATAFVRMLERCLNTLDSQDDIFRSQFDNSRSMGISALLRKSFPDLSTHPFRRALIAAALAESPTVGQRLKNVHNGSLEDVRKDLRVTFKDEVQNLSSSLENLEIIDEKVASPHPKKPSKRKTQIAVGRLAQSKPKSNASSGLARSKLKGEASSEPSTPSPPCVVFFDEASGLLGGKSIEDMECPLRCLQRALDNSAIIGVFLGTSSRLEHLESYNPSGRRVNITTRHNPPFIGTVSHDLFLKHVFFQGRPLWYSFWKHYGGENYRTLVDFAMTKLTEASSKSPQEDSLVACSLFALRYGFEPLEIVSSKMVAHQLAVMTHVSEVRDGRRTVTCRWFSEPVLSEASARITMGAANELSRFKLSSVVTTVAESITNKKIIKPSTGDKGEVVVAALLGYSMDILRAPYCETEYTPDVTTGNMSSPVRAREFLYGIGVPEDSLPDGCNEYYVNFTHFVRHECTLNEDSCYQAVARRAAFYVTAGAKAVDIVVVASKLCSRDGGLLEFMPIKIQVKNLRSKITAASAMHLLHAMSPTVGCQPILDHSEMEVGIVIATGTGGVDHCGEAVVKPTVSTVQTRSQSVERTERPYYGFLIGLDSESSFSTLRGHDCGRNALSALQRIAHSRVQAEIDPCFEKGYYAQLDQVILFALFCSCKYYNLGSGCR
jgi:hypothetical protein